ncbi:MAG: OB-fold nucleic acid binding domain-containing protein [Actinomycetota bacterium]|nr:OB-fold nucleic acid binding domain-containing protein [Actinomycetota bacterium]
MKDKPPLWRRLAEPAFSLDAQELQKDSVNCHAASCAKLRHGEVTVVQGRIRHVVYTPRESVPTVEAELFDGSGTVELVWLGRRRIPGIEPGRLIQVTGRVGEHDGHRAIYNPRYELRQPA